ncbi:hypothetical protein N7471_005006 [Penicillium samsonianum]|uniref:uncharacterized protein n=1 Tax=Penicillium samsonianum TaxID=1882272 RepID=UPI002548A5C1|nr:uncharacterized protein N7471_005006 [Penicillium samsonianum]KAJ6138520.1 hypothetical protein N7471_005006 [Penicillium samsonianum]
MPTEERVNEMRGYKATLSNPKVSQEAKQHAQAMLNELGGDQPREELYQARDQNKDPTRVSAGLKAAQHNPLVTEGGKQRAAEKMGQSAPEE